jgi:hypothetical protein
VSDLSANPSDDFEENNVEHQDQNTTNIEEDPESGARQMLIYLQNRAVLNARNMLPTADQTATCHRARANLPPEGNQQCPRGGLRTTGGQHL